MRANGEKAGLNLATRTYFATKPTKPFFLEENVDFEFVAGQSLLQQQKSIQNMHQAIIQRHPDLKILEISTKSPEPIGYRLSAFNLQIQYLDKLANLESVYQSTKVFEFGGPFLDLAFLNSLEAKKDKRLKQSGKLLRFRFEGQSWELSESPNFYDYLYSRSVFENGLLNEVIDFDVFTDFAYSNTANKKLRNKSHNCQARSAAIIASMSKIFQDSVFEEIRKIARQNSVTKSYNLSLFD